MERESLKLPILLNELFILLQQQDHTNSKNQTTLHQPDSRLKLKHPYGQTIKLQDLKDSLNAPAESLHNSRLRIIDESYRIILKLVKFSTVPCKIKIWQEDIRKETQIYLYL